MAKSSPASLPAIYPPKLVCALALIFTPVFGAVLQGKNWIELGRPDEARASRIWARTAFWLIGFYLVFQTLFRHEPIVHYMGPYFLLVLWAAWMITNGRRQLAHASEPFARRPIGRPIMLGAGGWILYGALSFTITLGLMLSGIEPMAPDAPEYGVRLSIPEGSDKVLVEELPPPEPAKSTEP